MTVTIILKRYYNIFEESLGNVRGKVLRCDLSNP